MTVTIPDTNYLEGRDGEKVEGTICHWSVGTAESALAHFRDPSSRVSAHYIIDRDGRVIPVLPESSTAYHAGDFITNLRTIGIEHVGGPAWLNTFTGSQYVESARLHRELSARYGFPLDAQHVRPHWVIVATHCPGTFDIARMLRLANEEAKVTEYEIREIAKAECRAVLSQEAWLRDTVKAAVLEAMAEASRRLAV